MFVLEQHVKYKTKAEKISVGTVYTRTIVAVRRQVWYEVFRFP